MRNLPSSLLVSLLLSSLTGLAGCGPGAIGKAVRPGETSVQEARGGGAGPSCGEAPSYGAPLVVDWPSEQRGDLEVAMKQGLGVVAYDCKGARLLLACKARGSYGFMGISLKKETIELKSADELAANLPLGAAKLSASLSSSSSIAVDLRMIGVSATTRSRLTAQDLEGDCAGATHFVQTATVGAFSVQQRTEGSVAAGVSAPVGDLSGSSSSDKSRLTGDGELAACEGWDPDASRPPAACKALLRLQLVPVAPDDVLLPDDKAGAFRGAACAEGFAFREGKCARSEGKGRLCEPTSEEDCERQCKLGHVRSCTSLGRIYREGIGKAKKSLKKSVEPLQTACEAGSPDPKACLLLARTYATAGRELAYDEARVRGLARRASWLLQGACGDGDAEACWLAGDLFSEGILLPADFETASPLLEQACNGGYARACFDLARALQRKSSRKQEDSEQEKPGGSEPSPEETSARVSALLKRACNGGSGDACYHLATDGQGNVFQVDMTKANLDQEKQDYLQRACEAEFSAACRQLASFLEPRDKELSRRYLERWKDTVSKRCDGGLPEACEAIGIRYSEGGSGLVVDPQIAASGYERWRKILDQRCSNEDADACLRLSMAHRGGSNQVKKDPDLVKEYNDRYRRSRERFCSGENTSGCASLAMTVMAQPEPDGFLAQRYLERACNASPANADACYQLGGFYKAGKRPPFEDDPLAVEIWWKRSCELGNATACASLARVYEEGKLLPRNERQAFLFHEHACKSSHYAPYLCESYERMLEAGQGTPRDEKRYFRQVKARCEHGFKDIGGCLKLSSLHDKGVGVKADRKQAQAIFDARVCFDGHSCAHAAALYASGSGVPKDPRRAVELYKLACHGARGSEPDGYACLSLARLYQNKKSGVTDPKAAAQAAQLACEHTRSEYICKDAETLGARGAAALAELPPKNPYKK